MAERSTRGKVFLYGCGGCGALLLIALVGVAVMFFLAKGQAENQEVVTADHRELPPVAVTAAEGIEVAPDASARLVVRLERGGIVVRPGAPGEGIGVFAEYDRLRYTLEQTAELADDGVWTYHVRLTPGGEKGKPSFLAMLLGAKSPEMTITIPPDARLGLDLGVRDGGGSVELGGLWLDDVRVSMSRAGVEFGFDTPTREPIGRMEIDLAMGGGEFRGIGNASPRELDIEARLGGGAFDLTGAWRRDADIELRAKKGGFEVVLPGDVLVEGISSPPLIDPGDAEVPPVTLRIRTESDGDDIRFRRR